MARMHIVPTGGQIRRPRCIPDAQHRDNVMQSRKIGFNRVTSRVECLSIATTICLERGRRTFRNVSGRIVGTEITREETRLINSVLRRNIIPLPFLNANESAFEPSARISFFSAIYLVNRQRIACRKPNEPDSRDVRVSAKFVQCTFVYWLILFEESIF